MIYKIAITDDCSTEREYVAAITRSWAEKREDSVRIEQFSSAEAFLFHYEEKKDYEILLLDIEMGGINGVELAKKIRQENNALQIIFITGFPDFMEEGFEVSALHYLMKPVSADRLQAVLDRAVTNLGKKEKRLPIPFDRETEFVPLSRILYLEAQKQYVRIRTVDREDRMKATLAETEEQLDEFFFKCQRSFVVNLSFVTRVKNDCVVLKNGEEIPISRGMNQKIGKEIIRLF